MRFQYKKLGTRKPERRHVHPHHLACIENVWYVFAYDVDRRAMRTFVLARRQREPRQISWDGRNEIWSVLNSTERGRQPSQLTCSATSSRTLRGASEIGARSVSVSRMG